MKATLTFNDPRWDVDATQRRLSSTVTRGRKVLKERIREKHRKGGDMAPSYISAGRRGRGFRRGHKVSQRGNPPSPDTLSLLNAIDDRETAILTGEVFIREATSPGGGNPAEYGAILDNPAKLNRPFFESTAEEFRPEWEKMVENAVNDVP